VLSEYSVDRSEHMGRTGCGGGIGSRDCADIGRPPGRVQTIGPLPSSRCRSAPESADPCAPRKIRPRGASTGRHSNGSASAGCASAGSASRAGYPSAGSASGPGCACTGSASENCSRSTNCPTEKASDRSGPAPDQVACRTNRTRATHPQDPVADDGASAAGCRTSGS